MAQEDPDVTINVLANTDKARAALTQIANSMQVLSGKSVSTSSAVNKIGKEVKVLTTAAATTAKAVTTSNRAIDKMASSSRNATSSIKGLVATYLTLHTATRAVRSLVSENTNFSETMTKVKSVSEQNAGFTITAFKGMQEEARRLGATTRFSASQAAEGLQFLSMAGFTAKESTEALESTLLLAQAGTLELGKSADIVSNIMSAFGTDTKDTNKVVDILAKTAATSNTSIEMLGDSMKFVAPIAAGLGKDIDETAAAIGILGNAGIQASMSGAGLRMVLSQLTDSNSSAVRTLRALGVEYEGIDPKANNLVTIFKNLKKSGVDVESVFAAFDARAANVAQVLVANADSLSDYTKVVKDAGGAAEKMSSTMDGSLKSAFMRVRSVMGESALLMGQSLNPAINDVADSFAEFITELNKGGTMANIGKGLASSLRAGVSILSAMTSLVSALVTALKPFAFILWGLIPAWAANKIASSGFMMGAIAMNGRLMASLASLRTILGVASAKFKILRASGVGTFSALATSAKGAGLAIKGALISTGIGALIVALGFVIEKLMSISAAAKEAESNINSLRRDSQELNIQYNIQINKSKTEEELDSLQEQIQTRMRQVSDRVAKEVADAEDVSIKVKLFDGSVEEKKIKDLLLEQGKREQDLLRSKLSMIESQRSVLISQLAVDKERTAESEKQLELTRKQLSERKKLLESTGEVITTADTEEFDEDFKNQTFDVQRQILFTVSGFDTLAEYEAELDELEKKRVFGFAVGEAITDDELSRLKDLQDLKSKLADINSREEESNTANANIDAELSIMNAKLLGQDQLASKLQQEADIRKKTLDLERQGIRDAQAKATQLIKLRDQLKETNDVSSEGSEVNKNAVVSSLQSIGGGGGVSGGSILESSSVRTANATELVASNTAQLLAESTKNVTSGASNTQTASIGTASQSQAQTSVLKSILGVLNGMFELSKSRGQDIITIT